MAYLRALFGGGRTPAPDADKLLAAQQRLPHWITFLEAELAALDQLIGPDGAPTPGTLPGVAPDVGAVQPLTGFQLIEE